MWSLLEHALTLVAAPRKRHFLAVEAREILYNRQPAQPLPLPFAEGRLKGKLTMNCAVQEGPRRAEGRGVDTGFPEPLSPDRNTTLRHPEADTSPNPTIEAPDIVFSPTHPRRSFLRHHSHRSTNSGTLPIEQDRLYDNIQYADGTREERGHRVIAREAARRDDVGPVPLDVKGEGERDKETVPSLSEGSTRSSVDEVLKMREERVKLGYEDGKGGKKGVWRKLRLRH